MLPFAAGYALHVHDNDPLAGEDHPVAHGLVGIDDVLVIQQQGGHEFGVLIVLLELEEAFVIEVDHGPVLVWEVRN